MALIKAFRNAARPMCLVGALFFIPSLWVAASAQDGSEQAMNRTPANAQKFLAAFPPHQFDLGGETGNKMYLRTGPLTSSEACSTSITGFWAAVTKTGTRVRGQTTKIERRVSIGLTFNSLPQAQQLSLGLAEGHGVLVTEIVTGFPAEKAGLRVGDIIVAMNQQPVLRETYSERIAASPSGSPVDLAIVRGSKKITLAVTPALRDTPMPTPVAAQTFTIDWSRVIGLVSPEGSATISIQMSGEKGRQTAVLYYDTPGLRDRMTAAAQYLQQACDKTKGLGF